MERYFSRGSTMNSVSAPSLCTPRVWLNWQAFGRPRRHDAHRPQAVYGESATSVPVGKALSPAMTVADTSCPKILGKVTSGFRPRNEFRSLPQNPTIRTLNNNSPGAATGSGTVSTEASPGLLSTRAFTLRPREICDNTDTRCERQSPLNVYYRLPKLNFEENYTNIRTEMWGLTDAFTLLQPDTAHCGRGSADGSRAENSDIDRRFQARSES